jgi:hypothetical protein
VGPARIKAESGRGALAGAGGGGGGTRYYWSETGGGCRAHTAVGEMVRMGVRRRKAPTTSTWRAGSLSGPVDGSCQRRLQCH